MGNLCSRGEHIRGIKVETMELQNGIARPERDRGKAEMRASSRGATARSGGDGGGSGDRISVQTAAITRGSRPAGPGGSRNFKVLEELEARKRKTRKADRDRA
ncbi:hypothetical protein HOY80DRAFT_1034597 [Tuber brumale]|nr:hypothetical protein HOY80DRAFT_1034597 [Tuber brumale]